MIAYLIAGVALIAALIGGYVKSHGDGVKQGEAQVQTKWDAANRAAEAQARAKEAADKLKKDTADAENKAAVATLNATVAKLRRDADARRAAFLPSSATAPGNPDTACFDRPLYLGAYGSLTEGLRRLSDEGSQAVTDLNTAKAWATK